jgi:hypothetical protein
VRAVVDNNLWVSQDLTRAPEVTAVLAPAGIRVLTVTQFLAELEEADE